MSTTITTMEGVTLTLFCGPVRSDGGDRRMYQVTDAAGRFVQLTPAQLTHCAEAIDDVDRAVRP